MKSSPITWASRLLLLTLPFVLGDVLADAVSNIDERGRMILGVAMWGAWALVLVASLVQLPVTLSLYRIGAPLGLVLGVMAIAEAGVSITSGIGLALAVGAALLPMTAEVGNDFVDGASYGDERRFSLRPPAVLLMGPLQLVWMITVVPVIVVVLMSANGLWLGAALSLVIAAVAGWFGFRTLNRLANRWLVLVPAGMTVVDHLSLAEPTLLRRDDVDRVGPAVEGIDALDLTAGASGLVVAVEFREEMSIVPAARRGQTTEAISVRAVLLSPSRPGDFLDHAEANRLSVQRG